MTEEEIYMKFVESVKQLIIDELNLQGLKDTGLLEETMRTEAFDSKHYKLIAQHYFKYVNGNYDVMKYVQTSDGYRDAVNELKKDLKKKVIEDIINGNK